MPCSVRRITLARKSYRVGQLEWAFNNASLATRVDRCALQEVRNMPLLYKILKRDEIIMLVITLGARFLRVKILVALLLIQGGNHSLMHRTCLH